jgi:hypothetical protein
MDIFGYKTFEDLIFFDKNEYLTRYYLEFPNKWGVSVVTGSGAYSDDNNPYEVAMLCDGELHGDPEGYCDKERVNKIMSELQDRCDVY